MLILGRKVGQKIRINNEITITLIESRHGCVRLGFDAPRETIIDREEIYHRRRNNSDGESHE